MKNSIYNILRGTFLISEDSFKYWRMILLVSGLAVVMIASSHRADTKVHEIAKFTNEVKELRSAFVDGRSQLMRLKMESTIIEKVKEKDILISKEPPKKIKVKGQDN